MSSGAQWVKNVGGTLKLETKQNNISRGTHARDISTIKCQFWMKRLYMQIEAA